jgi:hypothetical protein
MASKRAILPRRVIKLNSKDDDVILYEPPGKERQPYAALSYCWGGELQEKIKTTKSTLERNLQSISFKSLPLTLQHSIITARALGLEYIWIDSLCIIQDSASDWQRESALMCEIYSNATITISADSALDCEGGCFGSGPHRNLTISAIPCHAPNREMTNIYLRRSGFRQEANGAHATDNLARPRLDSRGWTLQERLLSPRVLHCTSTELVWQCSARVTCECQVIQKEPDGSTFEPFRTQYVTKPRIDHLGIFSTQQMKQSSRGRKIDWRRVVGEYTQRDLSEQKDRLPAISGLAALMTKRSPSLYNQKDYLFGIWRAEHVQNLLWQVVPDEGGYPSEDRPRGSTRFASRYAPSWSWASVTGRIAYIDEVRNDSERLQTTLESRMLLLDMTISLDTENVYGPGFGELVVRGDLLPVTIRDTFGHKFDVFDSRGTAYEEKSFAIAIPDVINTQQTEIVRGKTYHWLIVAEAETDRIRSNVEDQGKRPIGLLLEQLSTASGEVYKRIGLVIGHLRAAEWGKLYASVRASTWRQEEHSGTVSLFGLCPPKLIADIVQHGDALEKLTEKSGDHVRHAQFSWYVDDTYSLGDRVVRVRRSLRILSKQILKA